MMKVLQCLSHPDCNSHSLSPSQYSQMLLQVSFQPVVHHRSDLLTVTTPYNLNNVFMFQDSQHLNLVKQIFRRELFGLNLHCYKLPILELRAIHFKARTLSNQHHRAEVLGSQSNLLGCEEPDGRLQINTAPRLRCERGNLRFFWWHGW